MSTEPHTHSPMDTSQPPDPVSKEEETPKSSQPETYRHIAAAHIATLSEINHQLPKMLRYFATALTQLTDRPIHDTPSSTDTADAATTTTTTPTTPPDTLESRREAFRKYATFAGYSVNLIREELVRQIQDLEKHNVIPARHPKFIVPKRHGDMTAAVVDPQANVKNGGYGDFDVGVLNARASAGAGAGMDGNEDVLERVRGVLEELTKRVEGVEGVEEEGETRGDDEVREIAMVVDG